MVEQMTLQMLGSGESASTSILLAAELLALELGLRILSLTPWSHCGTRVVGWNSVHSAIVDERWDDR
jgi:hypothetical protein